MGSNISTEACVDYLVHFGTVTFEASPRQPMKRSEQINSGQEQPRVSAQWDNPFSPVTSPPFSPRDKIIKQSQIAFHAVDHNLKVMVIRPMDTANVDINPLSKDCWAATAQNPLDSFQQQNQGAMNASSVSKQRTLASQPIVVSNTGNHHSPPRREVSPLLSSQRPVSRDSSAKGLKIAQVTECAGGGTMLLGAGGVHCLIQSAGKDFPVNDDNDSNIVSCQHDIRESCKAVESVQRSTNPCKDTDDGEFVQVTCLDSESCAVVVHIVRHRSLRNARPAERNFSTVRRAMQWGAQAAEVYTPRGLAEAQSVERPMNFPGGLLSDTPSSSAQQEEDMFEAHVYCLHGIRATSLCIAVAIMQAYRLELKLCGDSTLLKSLFFNQLTTSEPFSCDHILPESIHDMEVLDAQRLYNGIRLVRDLSTTNKAHNQPLPDETLLAPFGEDEGDMNEDTHSIAEQESNQVQTTTMTSGTLSPHHRQTPKRIESSSARVAEMQLGASIRSKSLSPMTSSLPIHNGSPSLSQHTPMAQNRSSWAPLSQNISELRSRIISDSSDLESVSSNMCDNFDSGVSFNSVSSSFNGSTSSINNDERVEEEEAPRTMVPRLQFSSLRPPLTNTASGATRAEPGSAKKRSRPQPDTTGGNIANTSGFSSHRQPTPRLPLATSNTLGYKSPVPPLQPTRKQPSPTFSHLIFSARHRSAGVSPTVSSRDLSSATAVPILPTIPTLAFGTSGEIPSSNRSRFTHKGVSRKSTARNLPPSSRRALSAPVSCTDSMQQYIREDFSGTPHSVEDFFTDDRAARLRASAPIATEIEPHLFVGGEIAAADCNQLLEKGITHIVNCAAVAIPNHFPELFAYLPLYLSDSPDEPIIHLFGFVLRFIEDARRARQRVLIHCHQGVSRSCTFIIAYVMWKKGICYDPAYAYVRNRRTVCSPNSGFLYALLQWQKHLQTPDEVSVFRFLPYSAEYVTPWCFQRVSLCSDSQKVGGEADATSSVQLVGTERRLVLDPRTCYLLLLLEPSDDNSNSNDGEAVHDIKCLLVAGDLTDRCILKEASAHAVALLMYTYANQSFPPSVDAHGRVIRYPYVRPPSSITSYIFGQPENQTGISWKKASAADTADNNLPSDGSRDRDVRRFILEKLDQRLLGSSSQSEGIRRHGRQRQNPLESSTSRLTVGLDHSITDCLCNGIPLLQQKYAQNQREAEAKRAAQRRRSLDVLESAVGIHKSKRGEHVAETMEDIAHSVATDGASPFAQLPLEDQRRLRTFRDGRKSPSARRALSTLDSQRMQLESSPTTTMIAATGTDRSHQVESHGESYQPTDCHFVVLSGPSFRMDVTDEVFDLVDLFEEDCYAIVLLRPTKRLFLWMGNDCDIPLRAARRKLGRVIDQRRLACLHEFTLSNVELVTSGEEPNELIEIFC